MGESFCQIPERNNKMSAKELFRRLSREVDPAHILVEEPMSRHTTFRIGGPASCFVLPQTEEEICLVRKLCRELQIPLWLIGNGSNLLVSDEGLDGVVMQLYRNFCDVAAEGTIVRAKSGALLSAAANCAYKAELTGMEFAAGIPGTVGGAVTMNAGAYGGEIKDILRCARVLKADGTVETRSAEQLAFGYRTSCIIPEEYFVLEAEFQLLPGKAEEIRAQMDDLRQRRLEKQPLDLPSAGSTFKRPPGHFAGKLIQDAGLRGFRVGGAQVSEKHCGFVVNTGGATAADVMELIRQVRLRVYEQFQVDLEPEVKIWI